jgi:hypothetical protein
MPELGSPITGIDITPIPSHTYKKEISKERLEPICDDNTSLNQDTVNDDINAGSVESLGIMICLTN